MLTLNSTWFNFFQDYRYWRQRKLVSETISIFVQNVRMRHNIEVARSEHPWLEQNIPFWSNYASEEHGLVACVRRENPTARFAMHEMTRADSFAALGIYTARYYGMHVYRTLVPC